MKRILIALILAASLLVGCNSSGGANSTQSSGVISSSNSENLSKNQSEGSEASIATIDGEGDVGKYHVIIKSAEMGKDYQDADCIIITYEWTNNSDKATSFLIALKATPFQGATECSSAIMVDGVDTQDTLKDIKPGTPVEIKIAYVLNDNTTPIEVEVREQITFENNPPTVSKTFELPLQ